ncbi:hypothetical protein NM688_g4974 [Phlebia brevispora]|uniref:Uncharacterized protein n=1 Tax=Phlebia brevispora TaxID=194682 RepID=A0ACC1T1K8_9APHY|nr:hypothetical protein NM688_g4974 [Phlebia brevispora]
MVKVAIAGGTGHLGLCIAESIVAGKKHEVIVLSRSASNPDLERLGVKVVQVSYTDPSSLDRALAGVHTVIASIFSFDPDAIISPQLALLGASVRSGVKRFAPSEFNAAKLYDKAITMYVPKLTVEEAVRKSGLEFTLYECGSFMNYLADGTPGLGRANSMKFVLDVEACTAEIPGDGNIGVALTRIEDIGEFVAASLDLEKWPEVSQMAGDVKTHNQMVSIAEAVRGKKFEVTYEPVEKLKAQRNPNASDLYGKFLNALAEAKLLITTGRYDFKDPNLNKLCPQVKPMGIEEFLKKWFGPVA